MTKATRKKKVRHAARVTGRRLTREKLLILCNDIVHAWRSDTVTVLEERDGHEIVGVLVEMEDVPFFGHWRDMHQMPSEWTWENFRYPGARTA